MSKKRKGKGDRAFEIRSKCWSDSNLVLELMQVTEAFMQCSFFLSFFLMDSAKRLYLKQIKPVCQHRALIVSSSFFNFPSKTVFNPTCGLRDPYWLHLWLHWYVSDTDWKPAESLKLKKVNDIRIKSLGPENYGVFRITILRNWYVMLICLSVNWFFKP